MLLHEGLIGNEVRLETESYAAILGLRPSAGARSPTLWNAAFTKAGMNACMYPFDVTPERLAPLVAALKADSRFLGGACAVPHKTALLPLLDELEPEARKIGAVNCIYRRDGRLVGANTDGAGALPALRALAGDLAQKHVTVIGLGGAGRAVAVYLADAAREVTLVNRRSAAADEMASLLPNASDAPFPAAAALLQETDVLVNCTSLGSNLIPGITPLSLAADPGPNMAESRAAIAALPNDAIVYDIVYQPRETPLLALAAARNLRTLNGEAMNLEQAVLAFVRAAATGMDDTQVRSVMRMAAT